MMSNASASFLVLFISCRRIGVIMSSHKYEIKALPACPKILIACVSFSVVLATTTRHCEQSLSCEIYKFYVIDQLLTSFMNKSQKT